MGQRPSALCMPLLKNPVELTSAGISDAWQSIFPDAPEPSDMDLRDSAFTCRLGEAQGGVMVMPVPVPNDEVKGPAETSWLWPNAIRELAGYGAHAVVFVSQAPSELETFQAMTRLAGAIARTTQALGVYMGGAGLVVRTDVFVDMAQQMAVPVPLWVDLRCFVTGPGRTALFTHGLHQFGLMEIEIPSSTKQCGDLRMWTMSLAGWLIEERPTIKSGETVGLTAEERVAVEHAPSSVERDRVVMRLTGV